MYDAPAPALTEDELRSLDAQYCSWGDTVHYLDQPKFFESCEGSYMFDAEGRAYLDLQMWYSTVNFGYRNPRLNALLHRQLDRLPQAASQHLHREKVELAALIARDAEAKFGAKANEAEFAAFYVEPIQGTGGYVIPPKNFFADLKKVLDRYGILMVVDEVQMGIWRTGKLWAIEHFGVQPDVLVFGKSVTNGMN